MKFRPNGFSLLELLVSITVLSLITVTLYRAFFQISSSVLTVESSIQGDEELRLLMKVVLDDLQATQYLQNFAQEPLSKKQEIQLRNNTGIFSKRMVGKDNQESSEISFHAQIPSRFFPEIRSQGKDPLLHEVGYKLVFDQPLQKWVFKRREDFYIDSNLTEGGEEQILSESVVLFQLEFLESIQAGNAISRESNTNAEVWKTDWDSLEGQCSPTPATQKNGSNSPPCLPLAIRLTMGILDEQQKLLQNTLEVNLPVALQQ